MKSTLELRGGDEDDAEMNEEPSNVHAAVLARHAEIEFESNLVRAIHEASQEADIAEVYGPPRVTQIASKSGLKPGEAMDLTNGWDFRIQRHTEAALRYIREAKPKLVIGRPECRLFSPLQNPTKHLDETGEQKEQRVEAIEHIKLVVEIYKQQPEHNILFLHKHPAQASSWDIDELRKMANEEGVTATMAD